MNKFTTAKLTNWLLSVTTKIIILAAILYAFQWYLVAFEIPEYILPKPTSVYSVIYDKFNFLLENTFITAEEAILGFLLGNVGAYSFAIVLVMFPKLEKSGISTAVVLKATPIIALAPLFVIWFGNGMFGKVLMAALICFFPMLVNAITGLKDVEADLLNYMKSLSATRTQILVHIRIPSSLPYVFAAAKTSSTIAVVGAIVAELSGSDQGIGHILQVSIYQIETDIMFAAIIFVAVFGIIFYNLLSIIERIVLGRYQTKTNAIA